MDLEAGVLELEALELEALAEVCRVICSYYLGEMGMSKMSHALFVNFEPVHLHLYLCCMQVVEDMVGGLLDFTQELHRKLLKEVLYRDKNEITALFNCLFHLFVVIGILHI